MKNIIKFGAFRKPLHLLRSNWKLVVNIKLSTIHKNLITIIKPLNLAETAKKYYHEIQHSAF